jgi:hypothetical protein
MYKQQALAHRMPILFLIIINLMFLTSPLSAIELPTGMNRAELNETIDTLGSSVSSKFLSSPFALGGYDGLEIGISSENISTADLARLGNQAKKENRFEYNRLTVGKGLYKNIDAYLHFVPYSESNQISDYGGQAKWMFYESERLPMSLSLLGHMTTTNINDQFINEAIGWDLLGGLNLKRFSLYFGSGHVRTRTSFSENLIDCPIPPNCSTGIKLNADNTFIVRNGYTHSVAGIYIQFHPIFLSAQIDRYAQPVYSAKLGVRF